MGRGCGEEEKIRGSVGIKWERWLDKPAGCTFQGVTYLYIGEGPW